MTYGDIMEDPNALVRDFGEGAVSVFDPHSGGGSVSEPGECYATRTKLPPGGTVRRRDGPPTEVRYFHLGSTDYSLFMLATAG